VRHVGDEAELVLLDLLADRVALRDRGEAALGREPELLAREDPRRLLSSSVSERPTSAASANISNGSE
jgi:hypothetical protein